jgi:RHS repeat-associated protein
MICRAERNYYFKNSSFHSRSHFGASGSSVAPFQNPSLTTVAPTPHHAGMISRISLRSSGLPAYGYDATNRRVSQSATDNSWWFYPTTGSTVSYTANALNQYTGVGAVIPTYDGNGNLTGDGTFTYGYDAENRLTSASEAGNTITYAYNGQGRRKLKTVNGTTTIFVTDADNREVLEYDGTSGQILRWYAYGLGSNDVLNQMNVAAGTRTTLIPDIQGSIVGSIDSASGALSTRGYLPYGASATTDGTFAYTAQRIDPETNGLYYYRARMYMPAWGRFMQVDPIQGLGTTPASVAPPNAPLAPSNPSIASPLTTPVSTPATTLGYGASNLYAYVENDPLNRADPTGLAPDVPQVQLVGDITFGARTARRRHAHLDSNSERSDSVPLSEWNGVAIRSCPWAIS